MTLFTYEQFLSIIPEETVKFVKILLSYLSSNDSFKVLGKLIYDQSEKVFYKSLKSYKKQSEVNASLLQQLTFRESDELEQTSLSNSQAAKVFSEYYEYFTPFTVEEKYRILTPEDIIININKKIYNSRYSTPDVYTCLIKSPDYLIKGIENASITKKQNILEKLSNNFNKGLSISIINYYETAAKIYTFLKSKINIIDFVDQNNNNLIDLSLLIALFYYNHVPTNGLDEQKVIIDYFASLGITKEQIEDVLGIKIELNLQNQPTPTLVLNEYFKNRVPVNVSRDSITIEMIINNLINNPNTLIIKRLFATRDISTTSITDLEKLIKEAKEEQTGMTVDELCKDLLPNVISYLKRIARIYAYLNNNINSLNKDLINDQSDLIALSIFLSSYESLNDFNTYFFDNGVTLDKVLELLNLPSFITHIQELNSTEINEKDILRFKKFILEGVNSNKGKEAITVDSILINASNKSITKTSIIQKIFKTITNRSLNDNFKSQIENHTKEKEEQRRSELTESLLKNVSIEVYKFLQIISNYYIVLSTKTKLSQKDIEQLSIIMAATRFDKSIEKYLSSFGMTRSNLANSFEISFDYTEKPFDIDIIDKQLRPYIFDRKPEEITIYSIFENAFIPELTNSLNLRRVLNIYSKTPEDFLDIQTKLLQFQKDEEQKEEQSIIEGYYYKCNDRTKLFITSIIKVHTYLSTRNLSIIKNNNDLQELSILIALFLGNNEYIPFFNRNGITLETILNKTGLTIEDINNINNITPNKKIVLEYKKYLEYSGYGMDIQDIIDRLFDDIINPSKIIEIITSSTDNNYEYLKEEVTNKRERKLSPEESLALLKAEPVLEVEPSLPTIASYGTTLSIHSKFITDTLHELISSDSLEDSLENINKLASEIIYEETETSSKKTSILSRFFRPKIAPKTVKKYQPSKISDIQENIDEQLSVLYRELKGYDVLRKYIETFLIKLSEHLDRLKKLREQIASGVEVEEKNDIYSFTKQLNDKAILEILDNKISTFETTIMLMKQELYKVHRSIINHFITINALQTSKNAILPLIGTEIAIGIGTSTDTDALELSNSLISLFKNVVNRNVEATKNNLQLLQQSSLSEEQLTLLTTNVTSFLSTISNDDEQPNNPQSLTLK